MGTLDESTDMGTDKSQRQPNPTPAITRKKTWLKRIEKAKRRDRPKLKNWSQNGFDDFNRRCPEFSIFASDRLLSQQIQVTSILTQSDINLSFPPIHRLPCEILTLSHFQEQYELRNIPCIIQNIPLVENWPAWSKWNFNHLKIFKDRYFKVGEDDDGYKVKVRMKYFLRYLRKNTDDSPLYVFDSNYDTDAVSKQLLQEYRIPSYFPDDLFSLVGEKRRPPYRWFLVGPSRSGTCLHIDPLGTSAWNTLLKGTKRWVLFPPGMPKRVVKGLDLIQKGEDDEAINYFVDILPRIKRYLQSTRSDLASGHHVYDDISKSGSSNNSNSSSGNTTLCTLSHTNDCKNVQVIEFLQHEGETVFIPGGWWHAVINLTDTIAVTQNFCSHANFDRVWRKTRSGRKKMSVKWLRELHIYYPHLAARAERLNAVDGFVMYNKLNDMRKSKTKKSKK